MSDVKPIFNPIGSFAHSVIAPSALTVELEDAIGPFNYHGGEDVKVLGSTVLVTDALDSGHTFYMAREESYVGGWFSLLDDDVIAPVGTIPNVGGRASDAKPSFGTETAIVGSTDFPIFLETEVQFAGNYINHNTRGGKRIGACIIVQMTDPTDGQYKLFMARGDGEISDWVALDGTRISPTNVVVSPGPHDAKPIIRRSQTTAVPFPVVEADDLADITHPINAGDGILSGKVEGAMAIVDTGTTTLLYVAIGPDADSVWASMVADDTQDAITPS